ncbi:hypothetical protein LTR64_002283 [Lithohypha guttulata]|uniref:uncharacterized protein n=1 Tax=Lithohypha guttulata TaxID=1690604 RepID=UPI00315DBE00
MSMLVFKNATSADLLDTIGRLKTLLDRIKDEKLFVFTSLLLAAALTNTLHSAKSLRSLTEFSGDSFVFEDMYAREMSVPLMILQGHETLRAFLLDRYRGSNAESFVVEGNYNITIGRRDGPTFGQEYLDSPVSFRSVKRLILAVQWRQIVRRCPDCNHELKIYAGMWITCVFCQRSYFVRAGPWSGEATSVYDRRDIRSATPPADKLIQNSGLRPEVALAHRSDTHNICNTSFGALKNIDFDLSVVYLQMAEDLDPDDWYYDSETEWDDSIFDSQNPENFSTPPIQFSMYDRIRELQKNFPELISSIATTERIDGDERLAMLPGRNDLENQAQQHKEVDLLLPRNHLEVPNARGFSSSSDRIVFKGIRPEKFSPQDSSKSRLFKVFYNHTCWFLAWTFLVVDDALPCAIDFSFMGELFSHSATNSGIAWHSRPRFSLRRGNLDEGLDAEFEVLPLSSETSNLPVIRLNARFFRACRSGLLPTFLVHGILEHSDDWEIYLEALDE